MTSFPLARQNGRTIDRASTDERVSPSQTSANNVQKQCPRRQIGRLERAGRLRTGHRRFPRHTVSETGGFPPHTDGQGCEGLFSHLPTVHRCRVAAYTFFPSAHPCSLRRRCVLPFPARPSPDGSPVPRPAGRRTRARNAPGPRRPSRASVSHGDKMSDARVASTPFWPTCRGRPTHASRLPSVHARLPCVVRGLLPVRRSDFFEFPFPADNRSGGTLLRARTPRPPSPFRVLI